MLKKISYCVFLNSINKGRSFSLNPILNLTITLILVVVLLSE